MRFYGRGWGRNMGFKTFASINFDDVKPTHPSDDTVEWQNKKLKSTDEGVEISWGDNLQTTGSYMLWWKISKSEILRLFRRVFGKSFTREELKALGITVSGLAPTEDELRFAIKNMKVADLMAILHDNSVSDSSSSASASVKVRPFPRLASSASR